jgi:hypothetical protein
MLQHGKYRLVRVKLQSVRHKIQLKDGVFWYLHHPKRHVPVEQKASGNKKAT